MKNQENNFWILYANLIAALFFIFILVLAAVIFKYALTKDTLETSKQILVQKEQVLEQKKQDFKQQEAFIYDLAKRLSDVNSSPQRLNTKDKESLILLSLLEQKENEFDALKDRFEDFKQKLNNANFNKSELAKILQQNPLLIGFVNDKASIILATQDLFNPQTYIIKSEIKDELRKRLKAYFDTILNDKEFAAKIENIIIECHTSTDGSYMYNLDLSQKRAYEFLNFILSFYKDEKMQKNLIAVGKSYSNPIFKNGKEDQNASQRLEIKIQISNQAILDDIKKLLL